MKNKYFLKPLYVSAEFYTEKEQRQSYLTEIHCPQQFCLQFPYKVIM